MYKVLLTTSGTGSRLGDFTKSTNKSLILVNGKPIIDYIIETYPSDIEFVVTLGFCGNQVEQYITKRYSDRKFQFVDVDKYEGPGSSLGYSMLCAKSFLQCPFVFHCNDTLLIKHSVPSPEQYNWNGGSKGLNDKLFRSDFLSSFITENGYMKVMNRKGAKEWDLFHIGVVGIKDFADFWMALETKYLESNQDQSLNDCSAIQQMLEKGKDFKVVEFENWLDTGNLESLEFTNKTVVNLI